MNHKVLYLSLTITLFIVMGLASATDTDQMQEVPAGPGGKVFAICNNNGLSCSPSVTANITIFYPNGTMYVDNDLMTLNNQLLYYSVSSFVLGIYHVRVTIQDGTLEKTATFDYKVTPLGRENSSSQAILYVIVIIFFMCLFFVSGYGFLTLTSANYKGDNGFIIAINWLKYLKWFSLVICYLTLTGIIFFAWNISYAFLYFTAMENFLHYLFRIMLVGGELGLIVFFILGGVRFILDLKLQSQIKRGLSMQ